MNKKEFGIVGIFGAGLVLAHFCGVRFLFLKAGLLFGVGLFFEVLTEECWTYCAELRNSRWCVKGVDIHYMLPLGWVGLLLIATSLAEISCRILPMPMWASYILAFMIVGFVVEALYLKLGYWTYNLNAWLLGLYQPLKGAYTVLGVPVRIIFSYGLMFGTLNYLIARYFLKFPG